MKACSGPLLLASSSLLLLLTQALHTRLPKRNQEKKVTDQPGTSTPSSAYSFTQKPVTSSPDPETAASPQQCVRCCDSPADPPMFKFVPQVNLTILKGEKGDSGSRGHSGKIGKTGSTGPRGAVGARGPKGSVGAPGDPCKKYYSAFSVGRKKSLHSNDYYQPLIFDTELVNLYGHFNMFSGKFFCYIPGIYYFNLNIHTWNQKETYMHVMKNQQEMVILYAQPSDRSIMQSQSLMLDLQEQDEVWVRLFKGERENAVFSDDIDTYVTFNGYLIKAASET